MKRVTLALGSLALAAVVGTTAISESHIDKATQGAITARQSQMQLYSFNLGLLGSMAKGAIEYDAAAASAAAGNLAALSKMDQSRMWPKGSDNAALGDATAALPAIWAADSDIGTKGMALATAADAMNAAAGQGLEALQGAMGGLGGSCGGCHKAYRQSNN